VQKRKRKLGDRWDGYKVRTMHPMDYISPYIMQQRNDASNLYAGSVEMAPIEEYIRKKRIEGLKGFGFLHVFLAAYARVISQKPGLNRFISGQKIYQRGDDIIVNMMVKKELTLNAQETAIKLHLSRGDNADKVYEKLNTAIAIAKQEGDSTALDAVAKALFKLPSLLLRGFVGFMKFLDYFGVMPKIIHKASPFHGSLFVTDLGSLGLTPIYHRLYNFGNVPVFVAFGRKYKKMVITPEGNFVEKKFVDYKIVMDERIMDGHYYGSALKLLENIFKNPAMLDEVPAEIIEDID